MGNIQAILFDFDGTLAPNLDLPGMRRQVLALTRAHQVPDEVVADRYIVEVINAAHTWLAAQDDNAAQTYFATAHQLIVDIELEAAQNTDPFPGIEDKLAAFKATGKRLGVVTRNCRAAVLQVFPHLLDYVDLLHARDDTEFLKPDPRHLLACLADLNCAPRDAVMVGDGALDMHAGRKIDMYCVGVLSGSSDAATLLAAGAHDVIEHCDQLTLI